MTKALLAAIIVFALLAITVLTGVLSLLPGYPAVIVAFGIWCLLPGWFLQRSLLASRSPGIVEQLVMAFLMSIALAAVPGIVAVRFAWSINAFAMLYALTTAVVSLIAILAAKLEPANEGEEEPEAAADRGIVPLTVLVAIPLLAIATSPWWAGDRIARDADDIVYTAYITSYVNSGELDRSDPFLEASQGSFSRMDLNVWVPIEALIAKSAGVEGFDLHMHYLPGLLTLAAVAAVFALAKGLFGNTRLALLAAAFLLIYAILDLAPQEGIGRMVLLRMAQDKMVASFILVPAGVLLGTWYLARPSIAIYAAAWCGAIAALVVHPLGLMALGVALVAIGVLRAFVYRRRSEVIPAVSLIGPWVALGVGLLLWSAFIGERGVILAPYLRRGFNVTDLPGGMIMGNYHLLIHPMVIATVVLAIPAWWLAPRRIGNQALLGMVAGALAIFLVPVLATPTANATREEAVWRLYRQIPVAIVLAYVAHVVLLRLPKPFDRSNALALGVTRYAVAAPAIAVMMVFAVALLVQEQYAIADDGAFYNRTSSTSLLPWTGGSIFLGGVERAFSSDFRPTEAERGLADYLRENAPAGSIVLVDPNLSTRFLPGLVGDVRTLDYKGAPRLNARRAVFQAFFSGELVDGQLRDILHAYGVDFVVVGSRSAPEEAVQAIGGLRLGDVQTLVHMSPGEFVRRQGEPEQVVGDDLSTGTYPAWALGPEGRDEVVAQTTLITIPETVNETGLDIGVTLAPEGDVIGESVARIVVTLEKVEGADVVGDPVHTVFDVMIGEEDQAGVQLRRVRSPATTFSGGETYRVRVWRDGRHAVDTFPNNIWFAGLDVGWWESGPTLGTPTYEIYELPSDEVS